MSPFSGPRTWAVLLGSVALLSVIAAVTVRQRGGQEWFAQLPPGQCYANKPPDCAASCPNGVEMDLGNSCYCAGSCTDLSGNPGTCGAGTCAASCTAAGSNCATSNLPCCPGLSCNTSAGQNATCISTSPCNNNGTCDSAMGERTSTCSDCRCGDGLCNPIDEDNNSCVQDCSPPVCGNGTVQGNEQCDAGSANGTAASCCTASCTHKASGTVCRVADGVCDVAETCSGTNATCPQDTFKASTVECRASTDASCDPAEKCSGTSATCPQNVNNCSAPNCGNNMVESGEQCDGGDCCGNDCKFVAATQVCRGAAGPCDLAEMCSGTTAACPADAFKSSTTECRAAVGACNPAEKCSGSANCPADVNNCSTAVCGDGVINTNAGEQCDGGDCCGNDCKFVAATQVCRGAAGPCDLAEICSGTTAACPADAFKSSTTECRPAVGACNPAEKCSGTSATCPTDTNICPVGPNCGNGKLDLGEPCDGTNINGKTCVTQGFDGGTLSCKNCSFDTSKCTPTTASSASSSKTVFCCFFGQCKQQQPSDMCPSGQYADEKSCTDDCKKTGSSASSSSSEGDEETFICCFPDAKKEAQRCQGGMSFQDIEKGACPPSGKRYSGNEMAVCKAECGVWRNIGTCGGWSKYDPEMPAGPSTVVTGIPPTAISPLLNCNGGTAKAKWAGETGFCLEDGKCSETPENANECAGEEGTVFYTLLDCKTIEANFGKL